MIITDKIPEIQVSLHPPSPISKRRKINTSRDSYEVALSIWDLETIHLYEEFTTVFLARNNGVIGYKLISRGSNCGTVVNVQLILGIALKINASSLILFHNHPSSNLKPSVQDIAITKKISEASKLLDLKLLDHLIITSESYYSFADDGLV